MTPGYPHVNKTQAVNVFPYHYGSHFKKFCQRFFFTSGIHFKKYSYTCKTTNYQQILSTERFSSIVVYNQISFIRLLILYPNHWLLVFSFELFYLLSWVAFCSLRVKYFRDFTFCLLCGINLQLLTSTVFWLSWIVVYHILFSYQIFFIKNAQKNISLYFLTF